ncbi:MAG: putative glycolipid-binding domain-containing protein [Phyllobacterium sp.]
MFRPLSPKTVRWRPVDGEGLEHLTVEPHDGGIRATSVVIGDRGGLPYGVRYCIDCDARWFVRHFDIETTDGRHLALSSDGEGNWTSKDGDPMPEFAGCIDIDLSGTPFTNTLPIRRLELTPRDGTATLAMLYVPFDNLEPYRDRQNYACLEAGQLYRYEAGDGDFSADLPVDEDGLIIDYPTLFERMKV